MDGAEIRTSFCGKAGEPVPEVDPSDVEAVWMLGQETKKAHPGKTVGIGAEIFERSCKPGANIPAVTFRAGMTAIFLRHAPELNDKLDAVFQTAATIPMEWTGVGIPRRGLPFDADEFVRRVREAA